STDWGRFINSAAQDANGSLTAPRAYTSGCERGIRLLTRAVLLRSTAKLRCQAVLSTGAVNMNYGLTRFARLAYTSLTSNLPTRVTDYELYERTSGALREL